MVGAARIGLIASLVAVAIAPARGNAPMPNEKVARALREQQLRRRFEALAAQTPGRLTEALLKPAKDQQCRLWRGQISTGDKAVDADRAAFQRAERAFQALRLAIENPAAPRNSWERAADDLLERLERAHSGNTVWSWAARFRSLQVQELLHTHGVPSRCPKEVQEKYGSEGCEVYRDRVEKSVFREVDRPLVARCDAALGAMSLGQDKDWRALDCVGAFEPRWRCAN